MIIIATPAAKVTQRRYGAGTLFALPEGTLTAPPRVGAVEPTVAAGKFELSGAADEFPGDLALVLGVTAEGMTFTAGIDTEDDEAAEYYYPINTLVVGQTASMTMELKQVNLTNLRLALNAGADPAGGTAPSATAYHRLTPPLPGDEKHVQIVWVSKDENMAIILYRAIQTGELGLNATKGGDAFTLELEFAGLLPGTDVADVPFDILVAGDTYEETTGGIDDVILSA